MNGRELTPKQFKKMQSTELDLLIEFDRVCRENDIKYILDGGTLLGAVRHKGFIPWDDDADVGMLRKDYKKFIEVSKELNPNICYFQCHENDPEYLWGYGKLRRTNTECVRGGQEKGTWRTGIFIDVFPYDDIPSGFMKQLGQDICCFILRKTLYSHVGKYKGNGIKKTIYEILSKVPVEMVYNYMAKCIARNSDNSSGNVRVLMFPLEKRQRKGRKWGHKKEWFLQRITTTFEGREFYIPKNYDGYLSRYYGNYMVLPPEEKRLKKSYYSYIKFPDGETIVHK